jgi:hypothetical protein
MTFPQRRMLTEEEAEEYFGAPPGTLRKLRSQGSAPPFIQYGSQVRYDIGYLDSWVFSQTHEPAPLTELGFDRLAFTDGSPPEGEGWELVRRRSGRACWRRAGEAFGSET